MSSPEHPRPEAPAEEVFQHATTYVKLWRNAKGGTQIEVRVAADENTMQGADRAMAKSMSIYDALTTKYGV